MPKKQPRNAFYYFMLHFKEEQRSKGIHYGNMAEVAEAAGPFWREAPPAVRQKYETTAKKEKQKYNIPDLKYTSTGQSYAEIDQKMKEEKEAEETERNDIKNMVKTKSFNKSILQEDIFLMDVNYYCKVGSDYLIAESTLLKFNVRDGIKEHYHEIIIPRSIPVGYASDMKLNCEELCLDMPTDDNLKKSNYMKILAYIIDFLKKQDRNCVVLPPIFTMPQKVAPITNFIQQLCNSAAEDYSMFRIYKFDLLFFTLINAVKSQSDEGFPRESLALEQLKKDPFKYTQGLACEHHEGTARPWECSTSRARRWAYTALDCVCPAAGVTPLPARHLPHGIDLDGILTYKEQKRERAGPSVARNATASTFNDMSSTDDSVSVDTSTVSTLGADNSVKREKKRAEPLRMPKTDYSKNYRTPPELSESNFPRLNTSRGRGRGLTSSLNHMKLDE